MRFNLRDQVQSKVHYEEPKEFGKENFKYY